MRLWSLHPRYLDAKGLVALWREALLAQKVLQGKTKGYKNHPQLTRFKSMEDPVSGISSYLEYVAQEADRRNYNFNRAKISKKARSKKISVTNAQLDYEFEHLLGKLKVREPSLYHEVKKVDEIQIHPLFFRVEGEIESWEIV
ncbi:MAG: hypothetical protein CSA62_03720 [Planctomycetota bacterium]|nr:MAG: hypothetical protein CSA62_03720 [Planctomycetota bacterium]